MTKFIAVTGGKGGVGKTTTALNLGTALNGFGRDVIVLDGNLNNPDIGLHLGHSNVEVTFHDALSGDADIRDAIYRHTSGVRVIPGDIRGRKVKVKGMDKICKRLEGISEVVVMDCPADMGLSKYAEEALVVAVPETTSVTAAMRTIKKLEDKNITVLGVVLNRVNGDEHEMSVDNVEALLEKPVIGVIPESDDVRESQSIKYPVAYSHADSEATTGFKSLAAHLIGERYNIKSEKGIYNSFLRKMGYK
ncbi:P-loop NTPase [Candidatus Woesearchaeota archaeon]|nr:P-loop NTPase [Candidatus Woesearchaeota archaeon]